jgi:energy-converting hydrogenase Eha subunit A
MRLFLMILLAGLLSAAAGIGATIATSQWLPSYDDAAGRGLGEVFRLAFALVYTLVSMIALGMSSRDRTAPTKTMWVLLALPLAVIAIGSASDLSRLFGWYEIKKAFWSSLQIVIPLWCVVLTQWIVMRLYMRGKLSPA